MRRPKWELSEQGGGVSGEVLDLQFTSRMESRGLPN